VAHTALMSQTDDRVRLKAIGDTSVVREYNLSPLSGRAVYVARNPNNGRVYVANGQSNATGTADALPGVLHVFDAASSNQIATVPAGTSPFGLAINPVSNRIYVGNSAFGAAFPGGITVIDGVTHAATQADMSLVPQISAIAGQISVGRDLEPNTATGKMYFRMLGGSPTSPASSR
jgi:DNA-binding beta-propeller fold protein YncE